MNSLVKRKQEWELENNRLLQIILQQTLDALMIVWVRASQTFSFLLYLIYLLGKAGAGVFWALIRGPKLVRQIAPYQYQERHEFETAKATQLPRLLL